MKTIHHVVDIDAEPNAVYAALTTEEGLSGWWTTDVSVTGDDGDLVRFTFLEGFNPEMQVTAKDPGRKVAWRCVGGHAPWADNDFEFTVEGGGDHSGTKTRLRFWQHYATELDDDAFGTYNFNWAYYLESLRLLLSAGEGKPYRP